jgi:pyrimidine-nucleoside phosphorylase
MNMVELIQKKKDGETLTREELKFFIRGISDDTIPDYQTSALLMAICFQGLDKEETFALTDAMLASGDVIDLSALPGVKVDKHSTGGVGDKTSLIVAPLAAACGVTVAKMSGRGLGFSGGTIDKLEAIPGFRVQLSEEEFIAAVRTSGMAIIGQTADVVPADKKLYALRDVTATVDNVSLIAASIMSKKLASGSQAIVLDVKCGSGAFMKTEKTARELGALMVEIGKNAGKTTVALITDMDQPLGRAVGNSLEVIEACETLQGNGPADIQELCLSLAGHMIFAGGKAQTPEEGKKQALHSAPCIAKSDGYVSQIEADRIGLASQHLGAGRKTKDDSIDLSAGLVLEKKVGDPVKKGDTLAVLSADDPEKLKLGIKEAGEAFAIGENRPEPRPLIHAVLS